MNDENMQRIIAATIEGQANNQAQDTGEDEVMQKLIAASLEDKAKRDKALEGQMRIDDIDLGDGDSGDIGEAKDARATNFNTVETFKDYRVDGDVNAEASTQVVQNVMDEGGYLTSDGSRGAYGRRLTTFRDKDGKDIGYDMVASGAAQASRGADSAQAEIDGIVRRANGLPATYNEDMERVGQQRRDNKDEFAPWEVGVLEAEAYDRRSLFDRAFDRGTSETKAMLGGALSYIGEVLGNEEWQQEGEMIAFKNGVDARANKRTFESYDQVKGFGDAADYVIETLGELAPGLIVDAVATAGGVAVGAVAGAATGGAGAVATASGMAAIRSAAARSLAKGAKVGMYSGPALSGFAQSAGSMENRLTNSQGSGDYSEEATLSGLVGAATNTLPFLAVLGKSLRASGLTDEAAAPVLKALSAESVKKRLGDVLSTTATGAWVEGAATTAQTIIDEVIATEIGGEDWTLDTKTAVDNTIRAVLGGGAMGAGASATGNSVGIIREYNEARKLAAQDPNVDSDGYLPDTVETVEVDPAASGAAGDIDKSVEFIAGRIREGKAKHFDPKVDNDSDDFGVAGKGRFDSMTQRDVPNLKTERYDELRQMLEPKGKAISTKELGGLIDAGVISDLEVAQYAADDHYGAKTPVKGGYDREKGDAALASVFQKVVQMSRDGKIRLNEKQRQALIDAEESSTDDGVRSALNSVSPELMNIVYKNSNNFDGVSMFQDYAKQREERHRTRERVKKEAGEPKPKTEHVESPAVKEDAPTETKMKAGIHENAPDWLKEGRKPTGDEIRAVGRMLIQSSKKKPKVEQEEGADPKRNSVLQASKDFYSVATAKTSEALGELGKHYDFEPSGVLETDRMALFNKIGEQAWGKAPDQPVAESPKAAPRKPKETKQEVQDVLDKPVIPEGEVPSPKGKGRKVHKNAPDWIKEGRNPTDEELKDARKMLSKLRSNISTRVRNAVKTRGKESQAAKDLYAVSVARSRKSLHEVSQHYDYELTGNLAADKMAVYTKIVDSALNGTVKDPITGYVDNSGKHEVASITRDVDNKEKTIKPQALKRRTGRLNRLFKKMATAKDVSTALDNMYASSQVVDSLVAKEIEAQTPRAVELQRMVDAKASGKLTKEREVLNELADTYGVETRGDIESLRELVSVAILRTPHDSKGVLTPIGDSLTSRYGKVKKTTAPTDGTTMEALEGKLGAKREAQEQLRQERINKENAKLDPKPDARPNANRAPKPKTRPTTTADKLTYIKEELGTRDASDGEVGKLIAGSEEYARLLKNKKTEVADPSTFTGQIAKVWANREHLKKDPRTKQLIERLESRVENHEFIKAYEKAVDRMFDDVMSERTARERGDKFVAAMAETQHETGEERSVGDVHSIEAPATNEKEVIASYNRRRTVAEKVYHTMKAIKGIDQASLVKFFEQYAAPNELESSLGLKATTKERISTLDAATLNDRLAQFHIPKRDVEFTYGDQERKTDTRHLSSRMVGTVTKHINDGDFEGARKLLERMKILDDAVYVEEGSTLEEKVLRAAKSSFARLKKYREGRARSGQNRSDRGLEVRDNETGKKLFVDLDAMTRIALDENKVDYTDNDSMDISFAESLAIAVMDGISMLADAKLPDGKPAFSFDINSLRDDVVVFRRDGDKLASITKGDVFNNANTQKKAYNRKTDVVRPNHVSRANRSLLKATGVKFSERPELKTVKAKAEHAVKVGDLTKEEAKRLIEGIEQGMAENRTLSDLVTEDIGNIYRDEVSYDDAVKLINDSMFEGKLTPERATELIADLENNVYGKEFETDLEKQPGGELFIDSNRDDVEHENRDDISKAKTNREVLRHTRVAKSEAHALQEDLGRVNGETTVQQLESAVERAKVNLELSLTREPKDALLEAEGQLDKARKGMEQAIRRVIEKGTDAIGIDRDYMTRLIKIAKRFDAYEKQESELTPKERTAQRKAAQRVRDNREARGEAPDNREHAIYGMTREAAMKALYALVDTQKADFATLYGVMKDIDGAPADLLKVIAEADAKAVNAANKKGTAGGEFSPAENAYTKFVRAKHSYHEMARKIKRHEEQVAAAKDKGEMTKTLRSKAELDLEAAEFALKAHNEALNRDVPLKGSDAGRGRKIRLNRKVMKVVKRHRGKVKQSIFRFVEMTRTRLEKIHPESATRAEDFASFERMWSEEYGAKMAKQLGDTSTVNKGYEDSIRGVDSAERKAYEAFVQELNKLGRENDPSFVPVSSKVHLDTHAIERNREGFMSILRENDIKAPEAFLEAILEGKGYPEYAIRPEITSQPRSGRKMLDKAYDQLKAGGFLDTDAPRHLMRQVHAVSRWASWNKAFGGKDANGNWNPNAEFHRIEQEVHPANRQDFVKLMQGVTGRLGMNMSPLLRKFNSAAMAVQAATVLWFSGLASVPEVAAVYSRMRGDTEGMLNDLKTVLVGVNRREMFKVARDMDIITDNAIEHSLQEMYNMNDLSTGRVSQKIQGMVFQLNGQNYITKLTRSLAAKAGERYLVRAVEDGDAGAKRLAELGVTAKDVMEAVSTRDFESKAGKAYRQAVHRFVNEAVTNPRSTQLPLVANDPRFIIFTTLKKFFYGFYDNVHKALYKGVKEGKGDSNVINPLAAIAITASVAIPLALLSEVMREAIKYPLGRKEGKEKDMYDWGWSALTGTGALGPLTMAESVYTGTSYGNHPVTAALGPTTQLAVDIATLDMQPSRVVPLANQIPWMAKPINKGVKNLINN